MPTKIRKRDDLDKFVDDRLGWKRVADRLAVVEAARVALAHLDETPLESWGFCSVCDRNFNVLRAALEGKPYKEENGG